MQELFRAGNHSGADLFDRDDAAPDLLAAVGGLEDRLVRQQLDEARLLAGSGDPRLARMRCAELLFEYLPRLASDRELLRLAVATLIHARGFQLLGRLLVAVDGRRVRISLGTPAAGGASPPHLIGRTEADGATTFTVNERLYSDPSREAVIDRWSEELVRGPERRRAAAA
jgi:hypothetical protein